MTLEKRTLRLSILIAHASLRRILEMDLLCRLRGLLHDRLHLQRSAQNSISLA